MNSRLFTHRLLLPARTHAFVFPVRTGQKRAWDGVRLLTANTQPHTPKQVYFSDNDDRVRLHDPQPSQQLIPQRPLHPAQHPATVLTMAPAMSVRK